jgi:hypothetical protein
VCNVSASYRGVALPSSSITSVTWDWGDGIRDDQPPYSVVKTHTYSGVGTFTVFANVDANTVDPPGSTVYGHPVASTTVVIK